jgi:hypothetical protein
MNRDDIFAAIEAERAFQDDKYGKGEHNKATWTMLTEAEMMEAKQAVIKGGVGRNSWASEMIQVAALVVAALEQHGMESGNGKREL